MAVKEILIYPDFLSILKRKSESVQMNGPNIKQIIQDLKDTLLNAGLGVGLAAPQIGILKRIFILKKDMIAKDLKKDSVFFKAKENIITFINPKIIAKKGTVISYEGCLSIPEHSVDIERAKVVAVRAFNEQGDQFYEKFKGLAAIAIQQEIDHLDGILIIDHQT